jgi:2',3'-cyclic-nucleotide 2'-phosphodiesterase (5'-nucleotidase family)
MKPLRLLQFLLIFPFGILTAQERSDTLCILQLNDIYEIGALDQGRSGGMARVATIVKQHEARYQTLVVVAGDFVSPSVIGTTKIDGQRVNGKHMVDMMNQAGVDLVTFGNHEFDIPEKDLQQRINESAFTWISSDLLHRDSMGTLVPFSRTHPDSVEIPPYYLLPSRQGQFTTGFVSATIQSNRQPWVAYNDHRKFMKKAWRQAKKQADVVLALTHLTLAEDKAILRKLKRIPLLMGGHEHQHMYIKVRKAAIAKADANAKTMYRHLVFRSGKKGRLQIKSDLLPVDTTVVPDAGVAAAVKIWEDKAYASFRAIGLEPEAVVYKATEPLDGTEAAVRYKQTNLGVLIAKAMRAASPNSSAAVFNSGSIRIDDMIQGVVTQLDVMRTLPFGGKILEVDLDGKLLNQMLNTSVTLRSLGGYLQLSPNIRFDGNKWLLDDAVIDDAKTYKIAAPDFLFSGAEKGMTFLKEGNSGIKSITRIDSPGDVRSDIRLAVVKYLSTL